MVCTGPRQRRAPGRGVARQGTSQAATRTEVDQARTEVTLNLHPCCRWLQEMRCLDCIRAHVTVDDQAKALGYQSVAHQCLTYCRLTDPKGGIAFPGMTIATQCQDCVAHVAANKFCITDGNPQGQCNGGSPCLGPGDGLTTPKPYMP